MDWCILIKKYKNPKRLANEIILKQGKGLVVCGDDKGSLWLYNVPTLTGAAAEPLRKIAEPTTRLMWPELQVLYSVFCLSNEKNN